MRGKDFDRRNAIERLYGAPVILGGRGAKASVRRFALLLIGAVIVLVVVTLLLALLFG